MRIIAYTDGSSRGNPGRGGYGVVLLVPEKKYKKEFSQGYRLTTNNRMELMGTIIAMEKLKVLKADITIYTDSKYICDSVNKRWVFGWEKKNFAGKKNEDLWRRFLKVYRQHSVKLVWVKGHAGNVWNELADKLATEAADSDKLKIDSVFENENKREKGGSLFKGDQ